MYQHVNIWTMTDFFFHRALGTLTLFFVPRGVKRTVEAMRKPSIRPTTTTQAMTDPKRHQLITRRTPPTTPITADRVRQTVRGEEKQTSQFIWDEM